MHHIKLLKSKQIMRFDRSQLREKVSTIEIKTTKNLEQLDLDFLYNYRIFPSHILVFKTQWEAENRLMQVGDTIAQQVYIPPIKRFSQKIIFGVRINEIINQKDKKGFSYETLEGHVEKGVSIFTIEEIDQKVIFKIHTFSTPGNLLTKMLSFVFTLPYQTYCTNSALKNVRMQLEKQ